MEEKMIYKDVEGLKQAIRGTVQINKQGTVTIQDESKVREYLIDELLHSVIL